MQSQAPLAEDTISRDHTPTRGLETALSPAKDKGLLPGYLLAGSWISQLCQGCGQQGRHAACHDQAIHHQVCHMLLI